MSLSYTLNMNKSNQTITIFIYAYRQYFNYDKRLLYISHSKM